MSYSCRQLRQIDLCAVNYNISPSLNFKDLFTSKKIGNLLSSISRIMSHTDELMNNYIRIESGKKKQFTALYKNKHSHIKGLIQCLSQNLHRHSFYQNMSLAEIFFSMLHTCIKV